MSPCKYPKLRAFLNSLPPSAQAAYAARCKTTVGYLRKQISAGGRFGEVLAASLCKESNGTVPLEEAGPYVDWASLRASLICPSSVTTPGRRGKSQCG